MGIRLYKEPKLERPDLIASWPGIGNVGVLAVDTLRGQLRAEELGELDPWDFFYPKKVIIRGGILKDLEFPTTRFYYKRLAKKDVIIVVGEEQPSGGGRAYAEGRKAFEMASQVLDVAEKFGCGRVYTSGAAVSLTHHESYPRVWAVASSKDLLQEMKSHNNVIVMSEVEGKNDRGSITGLNGLLLGLAKHRGLDSVCLMGEIPDYISGVPFPYPRGSRAVLEVIGSLLGTELDFTALDEMATQVDEVIRGIYEKLPPDVRERIENRKQVEPHEPEAITKEDQQWLKEHIDELFRHGRGGGERAT